MPINPELKHLYPSNWKEIRTQILEREGHKCKFCGEIPECEALPDIGFTEGYECAACHGKFDVETEVVYNTSIPR